MSLEENKALVHRYWDEVWNQGNLALIDDLFTPGLAEGQKWFVSHTLQAFSNSYVTVDDTIAEGDRVVTRYTWRAVHTGVWDMELGGLSMAVPPTGKQIWDSGIAIYRIENGRLADNWSTWTMLELAQQLGVIPTSEEAGS